MDTTKLTKSVDVCAYEDCTATATTLAKGRDVGRYAPAPIRGHKLAAYCEAHADLVAEEGTPEYVETCPACGCTFGVN